MILLMILLFCSFHRQKLPSEFAGVLGDRRVLQVRLANGGAMPLWEVEVVASGDGVYLDRGWSQFASTYNLEVGHLIVFCYDSAAVLNVTVFDTSTCRKRTQGAGSDGVATNAPRINEPACFAATLKKVNLEKGQNQYLVSQQQPRPQLLSCDLVKDSVV